MEAPPAYLRELRDRICGAVRDVDVRQNCDCVTRRAVDWWESKNSNALHLVREAMWRGEVDIKLSELVNMNSLKLMLRLLCIESVEGIWNKASSKNQSNSAMQGPILTI